MAEDKKSGYGGKRVRTKYGTKMVRIGCSLFVRQDQVEWVAERKWGDVIREAIDLAMEKESDRSHASSLTKLKQFYNSSLLDLLRVVENEINNLAIIKNRLQAFHEQHDRLDRLAKND